MKREQPSNTGEGEKEKLWMDQTAQEGSRLLQMSNCTAGWIRADKGHRFRRNQARILFSPDHLHLTQGEHTQSGLNSDQPFWNRKLQNCRSHSYSSHSFFLNSEFVPPSSFNRALVTAEVI